MNIAGTVILYNPEDAVLTNILSYFPSLSHLYIYDNSSVESVEIKQWANDTPNASYFFSGQNEGISKRLNQAATLALSDGHKWLLTMDQDSFFEKKELEKYFTTLQAATNKDEVAMFGIEYEKKTADSIDSSTDIISIEHLITSGSILNLMLFTEIGEFDEALFIDEVDLEYCYRSITKGFKILKLKNVFLQHSLGKISEFRSFKSLKLTPRTLHSPLRVYYMVRNYLYVSKLYPNKFKENAIIRKGALLNRIKNNLIYGKERMALITLLFCAYRDFKINKMGKKH